MQSFDDRLRRYDVHCNLSHDAWAHSCNALATHLLMGAPFPFQGRLSLRLIVFMPGHRKTCAHNLQHETFLSVGWLLLSCKRACSYAAPNKYRPTSKGAYIWSGQRYHAAYRQKEKEPPACYQMSVANHDQVGFWPLWDRAGPERRLCSTALPCSLSTRRGSACLGRSLWMANHARQACKM